MLSLRLLGASVCAICLSSAAVAQSPVNTVRTQVPATQNSNVIVAGSAQDLALQEEIRKIHAYNNYINGQVGISDTQTVYERAPQSTITAPRQQIASRPAQIELYEPAPQTYPQITYANGNGQTIPVTTVFERQPVLGSSQIYTVSQGDTLYSLARAQCVSVSDIQTHNSMSSDTIQLGQVLTLPPSQCASGSLVSASSTAVQTRTRRVLPVPSNVNVRNSHRYAVLPQDSLYSIGRRYCVSAADLASNNGISTQGVIQPGQILNLPEHACIK